MMQACSKIAKLLTEAQMTLSLAESCTGGLLAHRLTNIPGSSAFFNGAIIAYANATKTGLLKIPAAHIRSHGAVSPEVTLRMAKNVRQIIKSDYGLSISGIAGPSGATASKPVGLVFIALWGPNGGRVLEFHFKGNRSRVKSQSADMALRILLDLLENTTKYAKIPQ